MVVVVRRVWDVGGKKGARKRGVAVSKNGRRVAGCTTVIPSRGVAVVF